MYMAMLAYHATVPFDAVFNCLSSLVFLACGWMSSNGRYFDAVLDNLDAEYERFMKQIEDHLKLRS